MPKRLLYALAALFLVFFSLFLRKIWAWLPDWINIWIGDYCWAAMCYCAMIALFMPARKWNAVLGLIVFSWAVEASQLWHTPILDAFRATWLGGLLIGHGFLWSDMLAYPAGILSAYALDWFCAGRKTG